ncbi:MAG: hypothetical protein AAGH68_07100 [Pseudomonadota bacterium]
MRIIRPLTLMAALAAPAGCTAVAVVDTAVGVTTTAVGTAVDVTGAVVGGAVDLVTPDEDDKDED